MTRKWTRSELRGLLQGDRKSLDEWVREHADFLYTWLMYRFRLSVSQARQTTSVVFHSALDEIETFRDHRLSMYRWLQSLGEREAAAKNPPGDEPETLPADWGVVPADLAGALAMMAEKPLPESLSDNSPAADLIRAAVADLDEDDRLILLARYHQFHSGSNLSSAMHLTSEEAQNRLGRARHEFRLSLYKWLRKFTSSIPSPSPSVRMEVFDANLETLFHTVTPWLALPEDTIDKLVQSLGRKTAETAAGRRQTLMHRKMLAFAAGGLLVVVLLITGIMISRSEPQGQGTVLSDPAVAMEQQTPPQTLASETAQPPREEDPEQMEAQLYQAFEYGVQRDIAGLIDILQSGQYAPQLVAAHFLGQYGDASVINPLQEAARQWYSDELEENPFLAAIETIELRLQQPPPPEPEEPEPTEQPGEPLESESMPDLTSPAEPDAPAAVENEAAGDPNHLEFSEPLMETPTDPNDLSEEAVELLPWQGDETDQPPVTDDPNQEYLLESLHPLPADTNP